MHSLLSSFALHWSQRSECGLSKRLWLAYIGYCVQFLHQCHLSKSLPLIYSTIQTIANKHYITTDICHCRLLSNLAKLIGSHFLLHKHSKESIEPLSGAWSVIRLDYLLRSCVFPSSPFFAPDFIIYSPIRMKTTEPAIGGTRYLQSTSLNEVAMPVYQRIVKRLIEAEPRMTNPIQNILVFLPSNISSHLLLRCWKY